MRVKDLLKIVSLISQNRIIYIMYITFFSDLTYKITLNIIPSTHICLETQFFDSKIPEYFVLKFKLM